MPFSIYFLQSIMYHMCPLHIITFSLFQIGLLDAHQRTIQCFGFLSHHTATAVATYCTWLLAAWSWSVHKWKRVLKYACTISSRFCCIVVVMCTSQLTWMSSHCQTMAIRASWTLSFSCYYQLTSWTAASFIIVKFTMQLVCILCLSPVEFWDRLYWLLQTYWKVVLCA